MAACGVPGPDGRPYSSRSITVRLPHPAASLVFLVALACGDGGRHVQLAGGIDLLSGEVTLLQAPEPLGAGSRGGSVCLTPRLPFRLAGDSLAIRTPYETFARPVVVALRAGGGTDSLSSRAGRAREDLCYRAPPGVSMRTPYSGVRLTTEVNVSLDRVAWRGDP